MTVREISNWGVESLKATKNTLVIFIPSALYPYHKRIMDLVLGVLLFATFFIPMLIISALIKIYSSGPVFYKQNRVGKDGKIFKIYKFRTMSCLENDDEFKPAVSNDPRVCKLGSFLRRSSLDELPNLINVIRGEMSLVGPRPHAVKMDREFCDLSCDYRQRYKVKPGVTGLAQINGYRGQTDTLDKILGRIRYDCEYIEDCSLSLDFKILISTISTVSTEAIRCSSKN